MAFHKISALHGLAEEAQINDRLADAHAMMRLPLADTPGLGAGCNFPVVDLLLAVVSGVSTRLMSWPSGTGNRVMFEGALVQHYPWTDEPLGSPPPKKAAEILWKTYRNPLTHALGIDPKSAYPSVKVIKNPRTEAELEKLELSANWPTELGMNPTLVVTPAGVKLRVKNLYWGVRRTIEHVVAS